MQPTSTRRSFISTAAGSALAMSLPLSSSVSAAPARKPNFLVIMADDMGFADIGCYGAEIQTPNLDGLAKNGVRFTQHYSTARCWPSRACLLTGYYPQQVRMDPPKGRVPQWTRLLPHYLKPAGYRCYQSGKWHVQGAPKVCADGGFDHSYKIDDHDRNFYPKNHTEDDKPLPAVQPGTNYYSTSYIADHAIKCLKEHAQQHAEQPFFQYLAFIVPHFPLQALAKDIAKYRERYIEGWDVIREQRYRRQREMGIVNCALSERDRTTIPRWNLAEDKLKERIGPGEAGYAVAWDELTDQQKRFQATKMAIHAAMIDRMDQEIGRVLAQIKAMGQMEDTVVLFVSDNGSSAEQIIRGDGHDPAATPGSAGSYLGLGPGWSTVGNTPFRLHKSWVHEGGCASPLIVHWPKGIAAKGELRHDVGHFVDIAPTMLEMAGLTPEPQWNGQSPPAFPGKSLVPAIAKDGAVQRECVYFNHDGHFALRMGDWKLVALAKDQWELYDLGKDRCEMVNLAGQYPDRVKAMAAKWNELETLFRQQAGVDPTVKPAAKPAGGQKKQGQ